MAKPQLPIFLGLAVALSGASLLAAEKPDSEADWLKRPRAEDLMAVWPSNALKRGVGGKATIACTVTVQGALRACRVISETPESSGFGGAAIVLSKQFLMKPARKGGVPVESEIGIPIDFPTPDRETGSYLRPVSDSPIKGDRIYNKLPWKQAPSLADMLAAYPARAKAAKVGGVASLDCRINKSGSLVGCDVLREEPYGYGFGNAAKSMTVRFAGPPVDQSGASWARSRVTLAVGFPVAALNGAAPGVGRPEWTALPNAADLAAVFPAAAKTAGVYKARVVMECQVAAGGELDGCVIQSEAPADLGYGQAAIALAPTFRLSIWTDEGLPTVGSKVRVPIRFDLDAAMRPAK